MPAINQQHARKHARKESCTFPACYHAVHLELWDLGSSWPKPCQNSSRVSTAPCSQFWSTCSVWA